jgi:membrane-bound serine protease (ClpP class)
VFRFHHQRKDSGTAIRNRRFATEIFMNRITAKPFLLAAFALIGPALLAAQVKNDAAALTVDAPNAESTRKPFGQFVTVPTQIDDDLLSRLTNLTRDLQSRAVREKRQAILVLEISPGSSRQGQIHDLAKVLVSPELSNVRTVAWIPKTIDGNHVILALACHDILMHPDAAMGDIGRGTALSAVEQNFVLDIVDRGRNLRMSRGIAKAMMDPASTVMRVTLEDREGKTRQQFLTSEELRTLQNQNLVIAKSETIKDPGHPGMFSGSEAARAGFLVAGTPANRNEVIEKFNLPLEAMRESGGEDAGIVPRVIAIDGVIGKLLADFTERETQHAIADGANMIIYDIDSPSGDKDYAQQVATLIAEVDASKVSTVAWVSKEATQASALVALSCDRIFMPDDAVIGEIDLKTMRLNHGQLMAPADEVNPEDQQRLLTVIKSIAQRRNRSVSLIQAMADSSQPVFEVTHRESGRVAWMNEQELASQPEEWTKGAAIPETGDGKLLLLNAQRAHELGLTETPCHDFEELRTRLGIAGTQDLRPVAKTWVDNLVTILNSSMAGFLLITVGIICIYLELHLPSGLFVIGAITSFSLFFWSRFLGGSAGSLELMLFLLGMVLLGIEFFVIPGFGVFGVSGILLTLASLVMASNTFAGMSATESFEQSMNSLGSLAAALIVVIAVAAALNRFLPSIPFINRLILTPPGYASHDGDGLKLKPSLFSGRTSAGSIRVGMIGTTASSLRPTGKAMFGDKYVNVVSDGAYIDHGIKIEVIRIAGNRIIVRQADETLEL